MRTILEIYYVRIIGDRIRYQRRQANLSKKGSDPNRKIQWLIQEKRQTPSGQVEEKEFIIHSTSWRHEQPNKIVLTYVAYSDELEFEKGKSQSFPLRKLKTNTRKSEKPRTRAALEKKVVSRALRHIAFLIRTDPKADHKSALSPETKEVLETVWISLAGKLF